MISPILGIGCAYPHKHKITVAFGYHQYAPLLPRICDPWHFKHVTGTEIVTRMEIRSF